MKSIRHPRFAILLSVFLCVLFASSCTTVPLNGPAPSPVAATGQDLNTLAAQATQAYVDYKAGNVNYAWAVSQALTAYQTIVKTKDDVKKLVTAWTGDGTYAEKLARIFAASSAPPEAKMKALQNGTQSAAANTLPYKPATGPGY